MRQMRPGLQHPDTNTPTVLFGLSATGRGLPMITISVRGILSIGNKIRAHDGRVIRWVDRENVEIDGKIHRIKSWRRDKGFITFHLSEK
jgi:hypothetical protein